MSKLSTPVQLQVWAKEKQPNREYQEPYYTAFWSQVRFVRDVVTALLAVNPGDYMPLREKMQVISWHRSKSVMLPVYQIVMEDGTTFTMRCNFYNWKISVSSPKDVTAEFMDLFDPNACINVVYCEGFPEDLVYGPYEKNRKQFTIELCSDSEVYMFFRIFSYAILGARRKFE